MSFSLDSDTSAWKASRVEPSQSEGATGSPAAARAAFPFKADVDIAELDERGRPGVKWAGKACEISRGHLVLRSRRLCYQDREILVAVHLIDDRPVALFGRVSACDYDGDGLHKTTIALAALPKSDAIQAWLVGLTPPRT
jgi:hypothetical protein